MTRAQEQEIASLLAARHTGLRDYEHAALRLIMVWISGVLLMAGLVAIAWCYSFKYAQSTLWQLDLVVHAACALGAVVVARGWHRVAAPFEARADAARTADDAIAAQLEALLAPVQAELEHSQ